MSATPEEKQQMMGIGAEALALLFLAFSILLLLGNFGLTGGFGRVVNGFLFGLFGAMEFVFPIVLFLCVAFYIANRGNARAMLRLAGIIILFFDLGIFFQLIFNSKFENGNYEGLFSFGKDTHAGGGLLCGGLYKGLSKLLGNAGTFIIFLVIAIICLVVISGKSFIKSVKTGSKKVYDTTRRAGRDYSDKVRTRREEKQRAKELTASEKEMVVTHFNPVPELEERDGKDIVEGSTSDTVIVPPVKDEPPIIQEITRRPIHPSDEEAQPDDYRDEVIDEGRLIDRDIARTRRKIEEDRLNMSAEEFIAPSKINYLSSPGSDAPDETVPLPEKEKKKDETAPDDVNIADFMILPDIKDMMVEADKEDENNSFHITRPDEEEGSPEDNKETVQKDLPEEDTKTDTKADQKDDKRDENIRVSSLSPETEKKEKRAPAIVDGNIGVVSLDEKEYEFPPVDLLKPGKKENADSKEELELTAAKLKSTLASFGINVEVTNISQGPSVTRYEIKIEQGVKVSRILSLSDDLKLNLAATDVRIEAPIPGKAAVGIEIPNKKTATVMLRDIIDSDEFRKEKSKIGFVVGKDIAGKNVVADIDDMPHLLIAGATGSGKSVCVNTIIMSLLYKAKPDEVKLVLIDPKRVELSMYNGLPHLMAPVVTDPGKAAGALHWGVTEMTRRFDLFEKLRVRDLKSYNAQVRKLNENPPEPEYDAEGNEIPLPSPLPQVVIIVDEMADLMMVAKSEVETYICRLAQLARAAGIHLIIATQRPSVDVITGLIKANMPSRIAFMVSSGTDSRTILEGNGAEKLLGKGDMLFSPRNYPKPERIQGPYVSEDEVQNVVDFIISRNKAEETQDISEEIEAHTVSGSSSSEGSSAGNDRDGAEDNDGRDPYFFDAGRFIIEKQKSSIGILQRTFKIGFNRAARIMDQLADAGVVSQEDGTKARQILMTKLEFEEFCGGRGSYTPGDTDED